MKKFLIVAFGLSCVFIPLQHASTQTLFAWPDSKVKLSGYHYLDNCIAAGARVWDSMTSVQAIVFDTVFSPRGRIGTPVPGEVRVALKKCLTNHTPTQIPRAYTLLAQRTYLYAGRFDDANAVVQHGLAQIASTDTSNRAALMDSAVQEFTAYPPYQIGHAMMYIDTLEQLGSVYRKWNLLRDYYWLMRAAYVANEDAVAIRSAKRALELAPLAIEGASRGEIAAVGICVALALRITYGDELLDSLRKGTAAYASLYSSHFLKAMGFEPLEKIRDVVAPVLQGDYWFPLTAKNQEYPRLGRVSIVVFVPSQTRALAPLTQLRRLQNKYPTVDLVLVASTQGYFGPLEPPPPEREAFLSDSVFRNFHRLNPVLSVTKGIFIQLDAPDSRRLYQPYPNEEAYPPQNLSRKTWRTFIIDDQRRIVDVLPLSSQEEGWTMRLLDTVLERAAGGQK